ncbi:conserved Plasmodium protein, unknown function [Plasmodium gallinaceum]|uniref:Dynein axonemal assembly factor 5 TPR repeats domain-containing protein n=1 Tax=Plasmodium gallinaceum TaxID=5849 RepID=A0A1J1GUP7_PLAGA|nr:conserved Plasmodium protein, unknown function [Plasmodium gallinaceum]CRG96178.1 conserved Plasmodium protein, unknown function [Plasmodium gallinaceum]
MTVNYHEENYNCLFVECMEHVRALDCSKAFDKEEQLNSLNIIYEYVLEFFNNCDEKKKKIFCDFFSKNLLYPLNKWVNDEFDECRNLVLNIYMLLEQNLDNILLDIILFKNIEKDDNFIFNCINRLREDENQRIIEDKEEIRLKILQFLYKIVKRDKKKDKIMSSNLLNFYIYLKDILSSLSILIKDPFPLIKKLTCELLCELIFEKEQKELNHIYRKLLKNLLDSLNIRQQDIRELILKCLKKLMCYDTNREFLNNVSECLKKLCKNKSHNVLFEIVNCIKVWFLNIKDFNNNEKAKLTYIILMCINAHISPSFNEHCYNALEVIAKYTFNSSNKLNKILDDKDTCINNSENFKEPKKNEIIKSDKYEELEDSIHISRKKNSSNKRMNEDKIFEDCEGFINISKLFYIPAPFSRISINIHKFFCEIKKELFYEIMDNEKNSWSEGEKEFANIITMFLIFTYNDNFYFIKHILSFLYKSLTSFKYIDYPSTPLLINDLLELHQDNAVDTLEKYCYEYESFLFLRKFVNLIITCGYLMPLEIVIFEIAHLLLGDNIKNILINFYKFHNLSNEKVYCKNNPNNCKECKAETDAYFFTEDYIFLNINYHKYHQKNYEKKSIHERKDIIIEDHYNRNRELNKKNIAYQTDDQSEKIHNEPEQTEKKNENINKKEEKKNDVNNITENNKKKIFLFERINNDVYKLPEYFCDNENCTAIIYENKKIIFIILSQILAGFYLNDLSLSKLDDAYINFILFLINENINYENVDSFPYILLTLKYLINIMKNECKNYSNVLFHFLLILQSDNHFCSLSEINKLIETVQFYSDKQVVHFYNDEYIYFIKNLQNIIDFNDFKNFKYNIEFLNILLRNISDYIVMEYSSYLMEFLHVIITYELKPFIKSEFLLFINFFCSKNIFPNFFLANSQDILQNILLPLCIWKSGLGEAEIRKGSLLCIKSLFINKLFDIKIFQNNILIENLVCTLKSSIDDIWNNENRVISISIIGELVKHLNSNNILLDLLDNLLKLLDDSNISIRKYSAISLYSLFQNKYLSLSDEKCEHIFPILLLHMDDDYSKISEIIYHILMIAKNFNNKIFLKHAKDSTENSLHAKSFKEDLMK